MIRSVRCGVFASSLGLVLLGLMVRFADAQGFPNPCCGTCQQPPSICTCTSFRPVVECRLRPQQVVTCRDVCETAFRRECYVEKVPVQRVDCVTVDEGCYKMVWVPRPVTKQVVRTECVDQMRERVVPFTVVRKVPQVTTTLVPERTVRYVPETRTFVCAPAGPACPTPCPPGAALPGAAVGSYAPQSVAPASVRTGPAVPQTPVVIGAPVPSSGPATIHRPTPDPRHLEVPSSSYSDPITVPSRQVGTGRPQATTVSAPRSTTAGQFSSAPSAAAVWRSGAFGRP